jgi:uncharacterized membrane protein YfcA
VSGLFASASGDPGILALGLALAGIVCGLASGILGIGGGIVIVPILYHVLATLGVEESVRMHVAVGTSLATMIPASVVAMHGRDGNVDWPLARRWALPVLPGVLVGCALLVSVSERTLAIVFAVTAFIVAVQLAFGANWRMAAALPEGLTGYTLPALCGGVSVLTGIEGTATGGPAMTLFGMALPRASATASKLTAIVAIPGTIAAVVAGLHAPGLPPWSFGYVNAIGFLLIAPSAFLAPLGARIADQIDQKRMRAVFAFFIAVVTARMLWDAFA